MSVPSAMQSLIRRHVPPGRWAVGVSGGADSVALIRLLAGAPGRSLHVVHLDHQTRGQAGTDDARFVCELARSLSLTCIIAARDEVERGMSTLPRNPSARFRAARMELFRRVAREDELDGVVLAHHADDQAETVLQRLIRGSGPRGLAGMSGRTRINGLTVLRPALTIRRQTLRDSLRLAGADWREDASNSSDLYLRNRLRKWLAAEPGLHERLIDLARACRQLRRWQHRRAPILDASFAVKQLQLLPRVLARESARRWLWAHGAPPEALADGTLDRLIDMAEDAAAPPRQIFPGGLLVRRREGMISAGATVSTPVSGPGS